MFEWIFILRVFSIMFLTAFCCNFLLCGQFRWLMKTFLFEQGGHGAV